MELNASAILHRRWLVARVGVCLGLVCAMVLSWHLWVSSPRDFPVLPCFGLPPLPVPVDWVLFLTALGLALTSCWLLWNRWIVGALVGMMVVLGLCDQMRWQPWAYQYLLSMVPMMFVGRQDDEQGIRTALDTIRLIIVGMYAWSGVHKFGIQFQRTYESDVVADLLARSSGWLHDLIVLNGSLVPWFELAIGVFLLFPRTRSVGIWMALGMHGFILMTIGPFGSGTNSVIWPWNVVTPTLVLALFWKHSGFGLANLLSTPRLRPAALGIAVLVLLMPARSRSKKWDQYLSFHLYSGHHQRMALMVTNEKAASLEPFYIEVLRPTEAAPGQPQTHQTLSFPRWAMAALNVPMPSEDRLQLRVAKILVEEMDLTAADFFYRDYPELLQERGYDLYRPQNIRGMSKFPPFKYGKD